MRHVSRETCPYFICATVDGNNNKIKKMIKVQSGLFFALNIDMRVIINRHPSVITNQKFDAVCNGSNPKGKKTPIITGIQIGLSPSEDNTVES